MNKKILLIYPGRWRSDIFVHEKRDFEPCLLLLYSYLKDHGMDHVDVLDLERELELPGNLEQLNQYIHNIRRLLRQFTFDIVGISCYSTMCYLTTIAVAKVCKELSKDCKIVVGGYHASALPEDFITPEGLFDFVVRGEGEDALLEICQGAYAAKENTPLIIQGTPRDLSRGVSLRWDHFRYYEPNLRQGVGLSFTRGCPFKCRYCFESTANFKPRVYPIDLALRDIKKTIATTNPNLLWFDDPLFPAYSPWGMELLEALVKEKIQTPLVILTRLDLLKEEQISLLSKLKVRLFFGIETGSERMLTIMKKTNAPKAYLRKIEENLIYVNERKILSDVSLIFNHPGETPETLEESVSFFENIFSRIQEHSIWLVRQQYCFLPGSEIYNNLKFYEDTYGTVIRHKNWWKQPVEQSTLATDVIPSREAGDQIQWFERTEKFINNYLKGKRAIEPHLFILWYSHMIKSNKRRGTVDVHREESDSIRHPACV